MLSKKTVLFLGYNSSKTKLIQEISNRGFSVENAESEVGSLANYDVVISYGYRHLLKNKVLHSAVRPVINLHLSYLPYNRGAHPNFWSFAENTPSGVTIHEIDEGVDTGPIVCQRYVNFSKNETTFTKTYERLNKEIEALFLDNFDSIMSGGYIATPQRSKGSYHSVNDLPSSIIKNFDMDISVVLEQIDKVNKSNHFKDSSLINQIESCRKSNNVNWMDLLRIAIKHSPKETKKVLRKIKATDSEISELFYKLGEEIETS